LCRSDVATNKEQDIAALYRNALRIFAAPLPVVAAVQGGAIGGGLGLALSADFRIATREAASAPTSHGWVFTTDSG